MASWAKYTPTTSQKGCRESLPQSESSEREIVLRGQAHTDLKGSVDLQTQSVEEAPESLKRGKGE